MAHTTRQGNNAKIISGITLVSNNSLSYEYFQKHFSYTIDFLNEANLNYQYENNPEGGEQAYHHYSNFIKEYSAYFGFGEESMYLNKKGNNVIISLGIVILEHMNRKLKTHTDLFVPNERYSNHSDKQAYISEYYRHQKVICDNMLKYLLFNIVERFDFGNEDLSRINFLSEMDSRTKEFILDAIRYDRNVEKGGDNMCDLFGINTDNVEYKMQTETNALLAYYLFNLIFLENPYYFYRAGETIRFGENVCSGWMLIDKETLDKILEGGNSGLVMQSSLPLNMFNTYLDKQEKFQELKNTIREEYQKLYKAKNPHKESLTKLTVFIEEQIKKFNKTEFYIGTKNQHIDHITAIITENNPKEFHNTKTSLPGEYLGMEEKPLPNKGKQRIYKSKTRL